MYSGDANEDHNIFMFSKALLFLELVFCLDISKSTKQGFTTSYLKLSHGLVIVFVITIFGICQGVRSLEVYFNTVYHLKLGRPVLIISNSSQIFSVFIGLILTIILRKRSLRIYNCLFKNDINIPQHFNKHVFAISNKAIIVLSIMILNDMVYNLFMSYKYSSEELSFHAAATVVIYYHYLEAYLTYSNIYWTHILLVLRNNISVLKIKLYEDLKLYKILYSKEERLNIIRSRSKTFFTILDAVDLLSLKYTPQLLAFCGKFVSYGAPSIAFLVWYGGEKHNIGTDYILIWNLYNFFTLKWMLFPYVSFTKEVHEMASTIHNLVSTHDDDDISEELFNFSLAMLHRDFRFKACGFFTIDYSLIYQVVLTIISYMVILIQFRSFSEFTSNMNGTANHITS